MTYKKVFILLSVLLIALVVGCEATKPDIIFHVEQQGDKKYPRQVEIKYFTPNDERTFGEDVLITFKWKQARFPYYEVYPVRKTDEGYIIVGSDYEDFSIPDPTEIGFTSVKTLPTQNGSFQMDFANEVQYDNFMSDGIVGWYNVVKYFDQNRAPQS